MGPKYSVGQKVIIQPLSEPGPTQRGNDINRYSGQVGEVTDFYWISPRTGQVFYIYNVRVGQGKKEVVVYEDEIETAFR
jgi:ribosomal protein L21E